MRGQDKQQADMFSYLSPEARVRKDHPLRAIRAMADQALESMSRRFDRMYAKTGRPSIPPEKLLRAQLIQMLYSVRSERLLNGGDRLQRAVPMVCGDEPGRAGVGRHRVHQESGSLAGWRCGARLSVRGGETGT